MYVLLDVLTGINADIHRGYALHSRHAACSACATPSLRGLGRLWPIQGLPSMGPHCMVETPFVIDFSFLAFSACALQSLQEGLRHCLTAVTMSHMDLASSMHRGFVLRPPLLRCHCTAVLQLPLHHSHHTVQDCGRACRDQATSQGSDIAMLEAMYARVTLLCCHMVCAA